MINLKKEDEKKHEINLKKGGASPVKGALGNVVPSTTTQTNTNNTQSAVSLGSTKYYQHRIAIGILITVLIFFVGLFGYKYFLAKQNTSFTDKLPDNVSTATPPATSDNKNIHSPVPAPLLPSTSASDHTASKAEAVSISKHEVEDLIKTFLDDNNRCDVDAILGHYDDRVNYYAKGIVSKDFIRKDKEYYFQRWPKVNYEIDGLIDMTHNANTNEVSVQYTTIWFVQNQEKTKRGTALNSLKIKKFNNNLRIVDEKSKVLSRDNG